MTVAALALFATITVLFTWLLLRDLKRAVARCRFRQQMAGVSQSFIDLQIVLRDSFTPALQEAAKAIAKFSDAWKAR